MLGVQGARCLQGSAEPQGLGEGAAPVRTGLHVAELDQAGAHDPVAPPAAHSLLTHVLRGSWGLVLPGVPGNYAALARCQANACIEHSCLVAALFLFQQLLLRTHTDSHILTKCAVPRCVQVRAVARKAASLREAEKQLAAAEGAKSAKEEQLVKAKEAQVRTPVGRAGKDL